MKRLLFTIALAIMSILSLTVCGQTIYDPVLTASPTSFNLNGSSYDHIITMTAENFGFNYVTDYDFDYYDSDYQLLDPQPEELDWLTLQFEGESPYYDYSTLHVIVTENDNRARSAYFKVKLYVNPYPNPICSDFITVNQAKYGPASLSFEFYGGRDDVEITTGMSHYSLGEDFEEGPKLNFDHVNDYLQIYIDEKTSSISYDIKGYNFDGIFKVMVSHDGVYWDELASYNELGDTETVTHVDLSNFPFSNARYIRWVYYMQIVGSGSVAIGNIHVTPYKYFDIYNDLTVGDIYVEGDRWTVRNGASLTITGNVTYDNYTSPNSNDFTIDEGGQLNVHQDVMATVKKSISGWTTNPVGGWYFIASPLKYSTGAQLIVNMLGSGHYDLYRLNNTTWENYKQEGDHYQFEIFNGIGYLYAKELEETLSFQGYIKTYKEFENKVDIKEGWNLVGNPFICDVYADRSYYKMNADGTDIVSVTVGNEPIERCTSILVYADADEEVTFSQSNPISSKESSNGSIQMTLTKNDVKGDEVQDITIVSFDKDVQLEKFIFNENHAKLYVPQNGVDYAVVSVDRDARPSVSTEIPVHFKSAETAQYTICFDGDDMSGITLIDKLENVIIDLGFENKYSFIGSPADRKDRFVLMFGNAGNGYDNDIFAYQNGNDIIIEEEGELQIFDVMGRLVSTQHIDGVQTINMSQAGVYILRLIGNETKIQRIVVR